MHDPGMEITAQAPKHFQKPLSVTTVYSAILECRLICSIKQKRRYKIRNVAVFSFSKLTESRNESRKHGLNTRKVENCSVVGQIKENISGNVDATSSGRVQKHL